MEPTRTNQLLTATWRANLQTTMRLVPAVAVKAGTALRGLMIGSKVSGTSMRYLRKGPGDSTVTP